MAKISVECGVTLHIGRPEANEYLKVSVQVADIDTEFDLSDQIDIAHGYLEATWKLATQKLEERIEQEVSRRVAVGGT